jgi:hypothetical protein
MTMHEYLERLNLSKYTSKFIEERCYYIGDLKFVESSDLKEKFKIKNDNDKERIMRMKIGEELTVADFAKLSQNQARTVIRKYI